MQRSHRFHERAKVEGSHLLTMIKVLQTPSTMKETQIIRKQELTGFRRTCKELLDNRKLLEISHVEHTNLNLIEIALKKEEV